MNGAEESPRMLRVLLAEDNALDAELVIRELKKSGYRPEWQRVDSEPAFRDSLIKDPPDVIISDHAMPQFSSAAALECLQQSGLSIPFMVVSHAIGEEEAVALMHQGAADFLMKDRLGRLGEAVRRALDQQRLREAHLASQQALVSLNAELECRIAERTMELEAANRSLQNELQSRKQAEDELQRLNTDLEQRVEERTRDVIASRHRLRALASELTLAEQRERKRLAGELHDYLAQMLALGRMKIAQLRPALASSAPALVQPVREVDDLFKNALTYTRSLMAKLSPPVLDELGLPAALNWLAEQMPLHGLAVEVRLEQDQVSLPDEQAVLLFQSVRELLINVAKHAGTDRATVSLNLDKEAGLRIEVQDTGRGFDLAAVDTKAAGEHFGLLSVQERMQAMGGSLEVQSSPGQGTTMILTLPLAPSMESAVLSAGRSQAASSALTTQRAALRQNATVRVLLVDDHVMVRQGLKALLEGFPNISVVSEAGDGQEAVAAAAHSDLDLVLMDINMPLMDGIEATKRIKQDWPDALVVGLSVNNSPQIIEAMRSAGAAGFVAKDAAAEQLYDTIVAVMSADRPAYVASEPKPKAGPADRVAGFTP
jgi:signal transduction histidine kinase/ActR/RegA family two-component response regulator